MATPTTASITPNSKWALSHDELQLSLLRMTGLQLRNTPGYAYIWLPTPHKVPVLSLPREAIASLLSTCLQRQAFPGDVVAGPDLLYWTNALLLAGSLVLNQHYLPTVTVTGNKTYEARWQPIYLDKQAQQLTQLTAAMPEVVRAFSFDNTTPPGPPAKQVLSTTLEHLLDYMVRSSQTILGPTNANETNLHQHWVDALGATDNHLNGTVKELDLWQTQLHNWQRPLSLSIAAPYRLCMRLEEPHKSHSADDAWYLRFFIQARYDPSLIIAAADIWASDALATSGALARLPLPRLREYLLVALVQAARLSPVIESGLQKGKPAGAMLNTSDVYAFLTQEAPKLEAAGFGLMLPAWWVGKKRPRLQARAKVKTPPMQANGHLSLTSIVSVDWDIILGDKSVSLDELQALAQLKVPLLQVRGEWVELRPEDIAAAKKLWQQAQNQLSARQFINMALAGEAVGGLDIIGYDTDGWLEGVLARLQQRINLDEYPLPSGFRGVLRPYQERGYNWLQFIRRIGMGACLADDMGLGKTVQTLTSILRDWELGERKPVLLVCPTSVLGNWQKEVERFTPNLAMLLHHGSDRLKGRAFAQQAEEHALVLTSYNLLQRDSKELAKIEWAGIVLDEAQNIKNPQTKQARAARSLRATYKIALTGTPVENHVGDLWSIMDFLNPGLLGSAAEYRRRYFNPIQNDSCQEAAQRLKQLTNPFILRRLKTDTSIIADLPEKIETKEYCTLTTEQASLYQAITTKLLTAADQMEGMQRKGIVLAALTELKQVCNHPALLLADGSELTNRSGKLTRLIELLEEVQSINERSLIFTQFAQMGELLKIHLQDTFGREVLFLHGGIRRQQRDEMIERFQGQQKGPTLFILSLKAGGTGLNLTQASHVFHFDRWWNPAVENQATDRAYRIGQKKNVQVHKFICHGTLEERIDEMITRKQAMADQVVSTGEHWLSELSTAQLRDLISLDADAVAD